MTTHAEKLLSYADVLDDMAHALHGPEAAIIFPRTKEVMQRRETVQVRADYKPVVNSHLTIYARAVAASLRRIAAELDVTEVTPT